MKNQIITLLKNNKLSEVIDILLKNNAEGAINLSARLVQLERDRMAGIMTFNEYSLSRNKLTMAILSLVNGDYSDIQIQNDNPAFH